MLLVSLLAPGTPVEVSLVAEAWKVAQQGWAAGGLAFVLFVLVLALFTEELVSGRRHRKTIEEWQTRYKENNEQWKTRLTDAERERDQYLQMVFARENSAAVRSIKASETVAAAAQQVVETVAPAGLPPPQTPARPLRWWQRL